MCSVTKLRMSFNVHCFPRLEASFRHLCFGERGMVVCVSACTCCQTLHWCNFVGKRSTSPLVKDRNDQPQWIQMLSWGHWRQCQPSHWEKLMRKMECDTMNIFKLKNVDSVHTTVSMVNAGQKKKNIFCASRTVTVSWDHSAPQHFVTSWLFYVWSSHNSVPFGDLNRNYVVTQSQSLT